jgi:hypothetical protein
MKTFQTIRIVMFRFCSLLSWFPSPFSSPLPPMSRSGCTVMLGACSHEV